MPINKIAYQVLEENQENYINILRGGQSVTDTGWTTYADSPGVNPVDGIGGTASITWSQNTSNPLSGDADLRLVKGATNRQGDGVSIPFTIANRHLAKVLQISFDMELISGTYSTGDLRVSIIQDPSGTPVLLEPVGTSLELGIANQRMREIATFQTHVSITSYRLCIHVSSTSTSAYTVDFANFKVWEQQQSLGAVITDWQSYTPTIQGGGTLTNVSVRWRRVGGSVEIQGKLTLGTVSSSEFQLSLPSGLTVSPIVSTINQRVGQLNYTRPSDTYGVQFVLLASSGHSYLGHSAYYQIALDGRSGSDQHTRQNTNYILETGGTISFQAEVPIAGWGSNVAMSSDTGDGRVVALYAQGSLTSSISGDGIITWTSLTTNQDTHGAFNFSTGIYTAPISGYYNISGHFNTNASVNTVVRAWVNGVSKIGYLGVSPSSGLINISGGVFLNAGEQLTLRPNQAYSSVGSGSFLFINRISAGSQVIATQETVAASAYIGGGNQTTTSGTIINFNTKWFDTHNAITTGTNWRFTAPMSGKYRFSGELMLSNASQRTQLFKNGSSWLFGVTRQPAGSNQGGNFSITLDLIGGDFIDLRSTTSTDYFGGNPLATSEPCYISIERIGI